MQFSGMLSYFSVLKSPSLLLIAIIRHVLQDKHNNKRCSVYIILQYEAGYSYHLHSLLNFQSTM